MRKLILLLLLIPSLSFAADPSSVAIDSGTFNAGGEVVISGANFGSTGANQIRNDNFVGGVDGEVIDSEGSGGWFTYSYNNETIPEYSDTLTRTSGGMSARQLAGSSYISLHSITPTTTMYVTGWFNLTDGGSPSRNVKIINMKSEYEGYARWQTRIDTYPMVTSGHIYAHETCDYTGEIGNWATKYSNVGLPDGQWHRIETYVTQGTSGGGGYRDVWIDGVKIAQISGTFVDDYCPLTEVNIGHYFSTEAPVTSVYADGHDCGSYVTGSVTKYSVDNKYYTCLDTGNFNTVGASSHPSPVTATRYWDELYVSTSRARVEVCNSSTWADKTHCEIQNPTTWAASGDSITIDSHIGTFEAGNTAYVYVVNDDGDVNATGEEITIGTGGVTDETAPTITSTNPEDDAINVVLDSDITIIASEGLLAGSVDTGSVTMSPDTIDTVTPDGSIITIATTGQSAATEYTITVDTTVSDDADTPNYLASNYVFSYTTAAASGSCSTDPELCETELDCVTEYDDPLYNWCPAESVPCKATACDDTCSTANWYLCDNSTDCLAAGSLYWWEDACRTIDQPQNIDGANLLSNPDTTALAWSGGLPVGWTSYSTATENSLGARLVDGQQILQAETVDELTRYCYVVNVISVSGQLGIYYYDTDLFENATGTKTGCFETPATVTDHGVYFQAQVGANDVIVNHMGLFLESAGTKAIFGTGTAASIGTSGTVMSVGN